CKAAGGAVHFKQGVDVGLGIARGYSPERPISALMFIPRPATKLGLTYLSMAGSVDTLRVSENDHANNARPAGSSSRRDWRMTFMPVRSCQPWRGGPHSFNAVHRNKIVE
ncbi:MAG: hypothetical protein WCD83_05570, partial [Pseudolabrys sp.]